MYIHIHHNIICTQLKIYIFQTALNIERKIFIYLQMFAIMNSILHLRLRIPRPCLANIAGSSDWVTAGEVTTGLISRVTWLRSGSRCRDNGAREAQETPGAAHDTWPDAGITVFRERYFPSPNIEAAISLR